MQPRPRTKGDICTYSLPCVPSTHTRRYVCRSRDTPLHPIPIPSHRPTELRYVLPRTMNYQSSSGPGARTNQAPGPARMDMGRYTLFGTGPTRPLHTRRFAVANLNLEILVRENRHVRSRKQTYKLCTEYGVYSSGIYCLHNSSTRIRVDTSASINVSTPIASLLALTRFQRPWTHFVFHGSHLKISPFSGPSKSP